MSAQKPAPPATSGAEPEGKESRTALERAANAADELYRLRDTFFPRDPAEKAAALRAGADAALALLDAIPPARRLLDWSLDVAIYVGSLPPVRRF
nr:unnamed protein product [Digitaria exilis]